MIFLGRNKQSYEQNVVEGKIAGTSFERKYGQINEVIPATTPFDVWEHGTLYPWDLANAPMYICSSDASDTVDINVVGQVSDGTFADIGDVVSETITLQGQTVVPLSNQFLHVYRALNLDILSEVVGTVSIFRGGSATLGVPDNPGDIRALLDNGKNKTLMCVWPVPHQKVAFIRAGEIMISFDGTPAISNEAATATLRIIKRGNAVRTLGKQVNLQTSGTSWYANDFTYPLPIPAGAKVMASVDSMTDDMGFTADISYEVKDESLLSNAFLTAIGQPGY